jgi:hypothetical protein
MEGSRISQPKKHCPQARLLTEVAERPDSSAGHNNPRDEFVTCATETV